MRPEIVDKYRELVIQKNKLENQIKKLKPEITTILTETGGFDDLYLQPRTTTIYDDEKIIDWLLQNYREYVAEVVDLKINLDRLGELSKLKKIDLSGIPKDAMGLSTTHSICTTPKKKLEESDAETN